MAEQLDFFPRATSGLLLPGRRRRPMHIEREEAELRTAGQSYEEAHWASLSPYFRAAHNRLRVQRGLRPYPEPAIDLYVEPPRHKLAAVDHENNKDALAAKREFLMGGGVGAIMGGRGEGFREIEGSASVVDHQAAWEE
jgi:hypothetical protein